MRLAFACSWWHPKQQTWSYTPTSLRTGLIEAGVDLVDIEAQPPLPIKAVVAGTLSAMGMRPWKYAKPYMNLEAYRVRKQADRMRPDVVQEMADVVVPTDFPTYSYQDMNVSAALEYYEQYGPERVSTIPAKLTTLRRVAEYQNQRMQQQTGILVMGKWYADYLVNTGIVSASKVHWVKGGIAADYEAASRNPKSCRDRNTVLFVGREYWRKGGDYVFDAVARLNATGDFPIRLIIAGPEKWPYAEPIPDWVDFQGTVSRPVLQDLYQKSDLFVGPSRFEAYGVAFLEARANGLPCIGRDAFAMPELIEPGVGGAVWKGESIDELAELIHTSLMDDELHNRCANNSVDFLEKNSWQCVAERIMQSVAASGAGL